METIYDQNNVLIASGAPGRLRFGSYELPVKSSNRGGDTIYDGLGLHDVKVIKSGLLSPTYGIVLVFYFPEGQPDEVVWTTKDGTEANAIAAAVKEVFRLR